MYVQQIKIRNLRCFRKVSLDLRYPHEVGSAGLHCPNINLLLGNNGAGKTTVLKALALSTLAPMIGQSGYLPYHLVRRGSETAEIATSVRLHKQDTPLGSPIAKEAFQLDLQISRQRNAEILLPFQVPKASDSKIWEAMYDNTSSAFLVLGYGATRRVQELSSYNPDDNAKRRLLRYHRVASLFEGQFSLVPLISWLPTLEHSNPARFKQVLNLLNRILPSDTRFKGGREGSSPDEYIFERGGVGIPFGALSDGYRGLIGWVSDMLCHLCTGAVGKAKLTEIRGLVLIDEIDAYLHPEWQRTVVGSISAALPNLQFVLTTHSPIVAGSLQRENIFVMEEEIDGSSTIHQYEERIYGMDADQVLLSSYFGLKSTRASGFVNEMAALSKKAKPGRPQIALEIMRRLAGQLQEVKPLVAQTIAKARPESRLPAVARSTRAKPPIKKARPASRKLK